MKKGTESKTHRRLMRYYKAYYEELRQQVGRYPTITSSFTDFLTGKKRIEAIWCKDGLVVNHSKSNHDLFEFKRTNRSAENVIHDLSGGRVNFEYPPGTELDISIGVVRLYADDNGSGQPRDPDRQPIWRSPWDRLDISGEFNPGRWTEETARKKAATDVRIHLTARLMNLPEPSMTSVMQALESATLGFIDLLQEQIPTLEDVVRYLRTDPVLIAPAAARILPETRLGPGCTPDFVAELADRKYVLVKLEAPGHSLTDANGAPSEELISAVRQVASWYDWIRDHTAEVREVLPGVEEPECRLIIGRRPAGGHPADALAQMNAGRLLTVLTYDDLLDTATGYLDDLLLFLEDPQVEAERNNLLG